MTSRPGPRCPALSSIPCGKPVPSPACLKAARPPCFNELLQGNARRKAAKLAKTSGFCSASLNRIRRFAVLAFAKMGMPYHPQAKLGEKSCFCSVSLNRIRRFAVLASAKMGMPSPSKTRGEKLLLQRFSEPHSTFCGFGFCQNGDATPSPSKTRREKRLLQRFP